MKLGIGVRLPVAPVHAEMRWNIDRILSMSSVSRSKTRVIRKNPHIQARETRDLQSPPAEAVGDSNFVDGVLRRDCDVTTIHRNGFREEVKEIERISQRVNARIRTVVGIDIALIIRVSAINAWLYAGINAGVTVCVGTIVRIWDGDAHIPVEGPRVLPRNAGKVKVS